MPELDAYALRRAGIRSAPLDRLSLPRLVCKSLDGQRVWRVSSTWEPPSRWLSLGAG